MEIVFLLFFKVQRRNGENFLTRQQSYLISKFHWCLERQQIQGLGDCPITKNSPRYGHIAKDRDPLG
jgi:hypothetical protein